MIIGRTEQLMQLGIPRRVARNLAHLQPGQKGRMEFRQADDKKEAELLLYDYIGYDWWTDSGMTASRFAEELEALGDIDLLTVRINSPGGDVWDGMAIFNQLIAFAATVHTVVEGIAASAASLIMMAGEKIEAAEISQIMIHDAWTCVCGNEQELREVADVLSRIDGQIASTYAAHAGKPVEEFREMMDKDTFLTATEALELGIIDGIVNELEPAAPAKDRAAKRKQLKQQICLLRAQAAL